MEIAACTAAIEEIDYRVGSTNTAAAIQLAREELFTSTGGSRMDHRHVIVVFTDGGSNDFEETVRQAALAKLAGIEILVVAITNWVNMVEIYAIASDPDDMNVYIVEDFDKLTNISLALQSAVCVGQS